MRPHEEISESASYKTEDVGKILQSNKNPQFATIHGIKSPDITGKHPLIQYAGDDEDTLMNQASPVFQGTGRPG